MVAAREISLATEAHGFHHLGGVAGGMDDQVAVRQRPVDRVAGEPVHAPQFASGVRVVGDQQLVAARDELGASLELHESRRRPRRLHGSRGAPDHLARGRVHPCQLGALAELAVDLQNHQPVVKHRRGAHAHTERGDRPEIGRPEFVPLEVERV